MAKDICNIELPLSTYRRGMEMNGESNWLSTIYHKVSSNFMFTQILCKFAKSIFTIRAAIVHIYMHFYAFHVFFISCLKNI